MASYIFSVPVLAYIEAGRSTADCVRWLGASVLTVVGMLCCDVALVLTVMAVPIGWVAPKDDSLNSSLVLEQPNSIGFVHV